MKDDGDNLGAGEWLSHLTGQYPTRDALVDRATGQTLSYAKLHALVGQEMRAMRTVAAESRCVWIVEERPEHAILPYLAALALGRRVCFATEAGFPSSFATLSAGDEVALVYRRSDTTDQVAVAGECLYRSTSSLWLSEPAEPVAFPPADRPEEGEVIFFSSGTTGRSKAIVIRWSALIRNANQLADAFGFTQERHLLILPLSHSNGQVLGMLAPLAGGGAVVLGTTTGIAALFGLWKDAAALDVAVIDCVPTVIQSILTMRQFPPEGGHRPRLMISGGAPISPATIREFESQCGVPLLQEYGLSEAVCVSSCETPRIRKIGTVGKPLPGNDIRILRPDGSEVASDERGRVHIRTQSLMSHYEAGGIRIPPPIHDGYLMTNDIGSVDNEGFLSIAGRLDDTLIKGGFNIVPTDVEDFLVGYPGLDRCAVLGVPCKTYGQDLVVFYTPKPGTKINEAELKAHLRDRGDRMWYPKLVIAIDLLPTTSSGKVMRRALVDHLPQNMP